MQNTTNTATMGPLNESLSEVSAHADALSEQATRVLETFDRLSEGLFGDKGPRDDEYWDIQSIRLGLEALSSSADLVRDDAHIAEDHAEDLAELVRVVERLKTA